MYSAKTYSSQKSSKGNSIPGIPIYIFLSIMLVSCTSYKLMPGLAQNKSAIPSVVTKGSVLKLYLKSHEVIDKFKVIEIDSIKISGVQVIKTSGVNREIMLNDIQGIEIRRVDAAKTLGASLVVAVILVPIIYMIHLFSLLINR